MQSHAVHTNNLKSASNIVKEKNLQACTIFIVSQFSAIYYDF